MRLLSIIASAAIVFCFSAENASAQSNRALEQLSQLNRINPLQNPEFDRDSKIINRKIIDRKNKVVGRVQDVIINPNGTIASIVTDFDRLRLGDDIALNYRDLNIRSRSNSYALNMDSDEIRDLYPQLLSNIETASGNGNGTFSVQKLNGAQILAEDGRKIARVKNVLFSNNGGIVRAINAELLFGTQRGKSVAIPFRNVSFKTTRGRLQGSVNNGLANAMLSIADN